MAGLTGRAKLTFQVHSPKGEVEQKENESLKTSLKEKIRRLRNQNRALSYQIENGTDKNGTFSESYEIEYQFGYFGGIGFMASVVSVIKRVEPFNTPDCPSTQLVMDLNIPVDTNWSESEKLVFGESLNRWKHVSNWSFRDVESSSKGNGLRLTVHLRFSPTTDNILLVLENCVTRFDLPNDTSSYGIQRTRGQFLSDDESYDSSVQSGSDLHYTGTAERNISPQGRIAPATLPFIRSAAQQPPN